MKYSITNKIFFHDKNKIISISLDISQFLIFPIQLQFDVIDTRVSVFLFQCYNPSK